MARGGILNGHSTLIYKVNHICEERVFSENYLLNFDIKKLNKYFCYITVASEVL